MPEIVRLVRGLFSFLLLLVPCALVALLCLEGAFRVGGLPTGAVRSVRSSYDLDNAHPGPFQAGGKVEIFWPPELAYTAHFNSLGCRGEEPDESRGGVLCIGDSLTFCMGVDDDESWPQILNRHLRQSGSGSVVNVSAPHLLIDDQIRYLHDALPALEPKIVVLMTPAVGYWDSLATVTGESPHQRSIRREKSRRHPLRRLYHKSALFEVRSRVRLWRNRKQIAVSDTPRGETLVFDESETRALRERYGQKVDEMKSLVEGQGGRLIVVPFPDAKVIDGRIVYGKPWTMQLAEERGYEFVDLVPAFATAQDSDGLLLWPHDMHASPRGNELIGRLVYEHISGGGG